MKNEGSRSPDYLISPYDSEGHSLRRERTGRVCTRAEYRVNWFSCAPPERSRLHCATGTWMTSARELHIPKLAPNSTHYVNVEARCTDAQVTGGLKDPSAFGPPTRELVVRTLPPGTPALLQLHVTHTFCSTLTRRATCVLNCAVQLTSCCSSNRSCGHARRSPLRHSSAARRRRHRRRRSSNSRRARRPNCWRWPACAWRCCLRCSCSLCTARAVTSEEAAAARGHRERSSTARAAAARAALAVARATRRTPERSSNAWTSITGRCTRATRSRSSDSRTRCSGERFAGRATAFELLTDAVYSTRERLSHEYRMLFSSEV